MTTLITGGNGFLGLALAEHLIGRGEAVIRHDRASDGPAARWLSAGSEIVGGDVRDIDALRRVIVERGVDTIVHAAAMTPDRETEAAAASRIVDVNVLATVGLLECCAALPAIRRVVVLGSVSVYGFSAPAPSGCYDEALSAPAPATLYGITKLAAEQAALRIGELHGLDVRVARVGPVYGPWEHTSGVRPNPSPHFQAIHAARSGRPVVLARAMEADWLYSRDAARRIGFLAQAATLEHRVYNVGAGRMSDLADWCGRIAERIPGFDWRLARAGEAPTLRYGLPVDRPALATARLEHEWSREWNRERERERGHASEAYQPGGGESKATTLAQAAHDYLQWLDDVGYRA
ncbi:NAD-dependent epimerase/dehydratase family protein [Burkholderia gladioli]|uniref:NAD-dependent epimerase/dehydratase family protein n=1 Tax=Burkholderia gladioli TaxID=28095 RepID=UPI000399F085|nr:NAD(P)-dependent oxidoreductase [Burkholderia gladioli]NHH83869.1 CDP-paratose 2-epimerase [Burkholderia gladioli]